jgi:hypothetical protein
MELFRFVRQTSNIFLVFINVNWESTNTRYERILQQDSQETSNFNEW